MDKGDKVLLRDVPKANRLTGGPDGRGGTEGGPVTAFLYSPSCGGRITRVRPIVYGGSPPEGGDAWLGLFDACGLSTAEVPMLSDGTFDWESLPPGYPKDLWKEMRWSFDAAELVRYL